MSQEQTPLGVVSDETGAITVSVTALGVVTVELEWNAKSTLEVIPFTVALHALINDAIGQYRIAKFQQSLDASSRTRAEGSTSAELTLDERMERLNERVDEAHKRIAQIRSEGAQVHPVAVGELDQVWIEEQAGAITGLKVDSGFYEQAPVEALAAAINACLLQLDAAWRTPASQGTTEGTT